MKGQVVHFEIPADNVQRATEFYKKTFEWHIDAVPAMDYSMIRTTESDGEGMPKSPGAINGGMGKRSDSLAHPVVTILVEDIDAAGKLITQHGGKVTVPKQSIGEMGFIGYFKDTEGNTIGLFQMASK
ncbi:MAG: VOC family protein [Thermoplasmata archaeon]|nr:VOC family protein [Thermoplasmata archaeon]